MKIYKRVFLLIFLLLSVSCLHAQIIKGKVTDAGTGMPIPNASVFLNGTYTGTTTDSLGNFHLSITNTNIPLIISSLGYEAKKTDNYSDTSTLNIALKPQPQELKEVVIGADEMSREKKMKIFLTEFIGSTNHDCVIENADDIWLHYTKKSEELTAGSDKPLIIRNRKLGYKITYFLNDFRHVPLSTTYKGNYIFAEDTVGLKPSEIKKILLDRDKVYWGSRMHFIRSLWADKLSENKFTVYQPTGKTLIRRRNTYTYNHPMVGRDTSLIKYKNLIKIVNDHIYHHQKFLVIPGEISIIYKKDKKDQKTSFIGISQDHASSLIDSDGNYGYGLQWKGEMGISRVNQLLPNEFQPIGRIN